MQIQVVRERTDFVSISVEFDEDDLALAFPCEGANTELYFSLFNACGKDVSEELQVFSDVAQLIETGQQAASLNLSASEPIPRNPQPKTAVEDEGDDDAS